MKRYVEGIEVLNKIKSGVTSEENDLLMKSLGVGYFHLYSRKRHTLGFSPDFSHPNVASCFDYAKQVVGCLGVAFDKKCFSDESPEAEMLDITMNDIIANIRKPQSKLKSLVRCLLCRQKCQKIIRSHIWPNFCLKFFTQPANASNVPSSKKIFDSSIANYGSLLGPGEITYPMLCQKCENLFSQYENAFKSGFFDVLYDPKIEQHRPEEVIINLDNDGCKDWLYFFCISMIFRTIGISMGGFLRIRGNADEIYCLFKKCRKLLLDKDSAQGLIKKPQVAIFITPILTLLKVLPDISPSLKSILFSKGVCTISSLHLYNCEKLDRKADYFLCSIGTINIIVGVDGNCFDLIPSESKVTLGQKQFIVPPAIKRYLIFPRGILRDFEDMASSKAERALKTTRSIQQEWMTSEHESFIEHTIIQICNLDLNSASTKEDNIVINYLPEPFREMEYVLDVRKIPSVKVLLHSTSMAEDAEIFTTGLILAMVKEKSVCALVSIVRDPYKVFTAYELSEDLSIKGLLQCKNVKILEAVEKKFDTRALFERELSVALKRTGFESMSNLGSLMQDYL